MIKSKTTYGYSHNHYGYDPREFDLNIKGYSGNNEVIVECPNPDHNDSNPSACFNSASGLLYCFSCGYSANIYQLAKLAGITKFSQKQVVYDKPDSEQLWQEFYKAPLALHNSYLFKRWIGDLDIIDYDIRQIKRGVVFLFKDIKGKIVGCQMRQYENKPKYLTFGERILFDLTKLRKYNPDKPLYLTEGVFGAIRGYQSGFQTLSVIGAMVKESTLEPILNWRNIYGVFDNDLAGSIAACRLLKFVPQAKVILGATADEMDNEQWNNLHDSYVTTRSISDIIKLSNDPDKLRKYIR